MKTEEKELIIKLIEKFASFSKLAMEQSEKAIQERNWVKGERKETESETWLEASRTLKREFELLPVAPEGNTPSSNQVK